MQNKKIVVSDYDGTFYLNETGIIENVNKVNEFRAKGNLFIIATGNNLKRFEKVIMKYGICCDYLILDQGTCIFDKNKNLLKSCFIDYDISKKIINKANQITNQYKICNPYDDNGDIEEKNITKIGIDFIDLQEAFKFTENVNREYSQYVHAYTMIFDKINIVEIISNETDKNEAIKYIAKKEKIKKDNVYTVGDGYNDISMIENFNGYCMKNAVDKLLDKCDKRVTTVAELIDKIN